MSRHAIVNLDGVIVNVVEWRSPQDEWLPPRGYYVIEIADDPYGIGDLYDFKQKKFSIHPDRIGKPE